MLAIVNVMRTRPCPTPEGFRLRSPGIHSRAWPEGIRIFLANPIIPGRCPGPPASAWQPPSPPSVSGRRPHRLGNRHHCARLVGQRATPANPVTPRRLVPVAGSIGQPRQPRTGGTWIAGENANAIILGYPRRGNWTPQPQPRRHDAAAFRHGNQRVNRRSATGRIAGRCRPRAWPARRRPYRW